jgi:CheY-like chemotaxis protein
VVDDHAVNRMVLLDMLRSWGCHPEEATDARDAMEKLRAAADTGDPFRVALLDMCMPEEDGESLARRILADPMLKATKMIMITSLGTNGTKVDLTQIGVEGSLVKPVRRGRLHDLLASVLDDTGTSKAPEPETPVMREKIAHHGRILLAEDNITNQLVAERVLEKLGQRVDVAANGLEALAALRSIPYDLVLMDCQMPEMDGFEATRRIRSGDAGEAHRSIPIIAMTARAMQGDREKCLDAGMDDYLAKPINTAALIDMLNTWLSRKGELVKRETGAAADDNESRPVLNLPEVRERLMNSDDLVTQVIDTFIEDTPKRLARLRESLASGDMADATLQSHSIKGAAAAVSAGRVREAALAMEKACRAGVDADRVISLLPSLEREFEELKLFVGKVRRSVTA